MKTVIALAVISIFGIGFSASHASACETGERICQDDWVYVCDPSYGWRQIGEKCREKSTLGSLVERARSTEVEKCIGRCESKLEECLSRSSQAQCAAGLQVCKNVCRFTGGE